MKIIIRRTGEGVEEINIKGFFFDTHKNEIIKPTLIRVHGDDNKWKSVDANHTWDESNDYRYEEYFMNEILGGYSSVTIGDSTIGKADGITENLARTLSKKLQRYFSYSAFLETEIVLVVGGNELWIEKPYAINGVKMSLKELSFKLSRIIQAFGNISKRYPKEEHKVEIKKAIRGIMKTPEDILYCLENRVPFYFFVEGKKEKVRLNLKRIGSSNYALEISDGKWGEIQESDLTTYLGHYLHGSKRGSWKFLSPSKLYSRIMGKDPMESQLKVMIAFLLQNRTQDIVEKRAKQLIDDMAIQFKDRILVIPSVESEDGQKDNFGIRRTPMKVLVKGQKTDWLLVECVRNYGDESNPQRVHTHCLMTEIENQGQDDEYKVTRWNGPICINTGGKNPSLGDQFASRIFSLMNDSSVSARVNTIGDYMINQQDRIRIPLEGGFTNEKDQYKYDEMLGMSIQ
tara:strand:+ start:592 stop:1965 length:1374 start_codon:yes stop_codon:yes gene_type:complete